MKICVLGNQSRTVYLFWRVLILQLIAAGHKVLCLAPSGDTAMDNSLRKLGAQVQHYRLDRKGVNPLRDIVTFLNLKQIFKREHPDLLFATTIKGVIYGCLAARRRVPHVYATITGLGYAFEVDTFVKKCINRLSIFLYKAALSKTEGIFFQNKDDAALFRRVRILGSQSRVLFARGTGVDIRHFAAAPLSEKTTTSVFLMVGRLLEAKGYREYAKAASLLKHTWPHAHFQILGPQEYGRGSISPSELQSWINTGSVEYLGEAKDVRPFVTACQVMVLPSWREGTPTAIMEGMSLGRAAIVTDVPGCREVVKDGENGLLVPARNPQALAAAMEHFMKKPSLAVDMGKKGREIAVRVFDAQIVAKGILKDMHVPTACVVGGKND